MALYCQTLNKHKDLYRDRACTDIMSSFFPLHADSKYIVNDPWIQISTIIWLILDFGNSMT